MSTQKLLTSIGNRAASVRLKCVNLADRLLGTLTPDPRTRRWIRWACIGAVAALAFWIGASVSLFGFGFLADGLLAIVLGLLILGLIRLLLALVAGLYRLLTRIGTTMAVAAAIALGVLIGLPPMLMFPIGFTLVAIAVLAAVATALFTRKPPRPMAGLAAGLPALAAGIVLAVWIGGTGGREDPVESLVESRQGHPADLADLVEPGPYQVARLTYGSGKDRHRNEYADEADWKTDSVDGRIMLGEPDGFALSLRSRWWGFGLDELPINGRVWYPQDAQGSLPLVLVVHGNHNMVRFSDPGYEWLGEHLASRGHVVVSVDQNFLNASIIGGINRENAARGWMLLKHLEAWRGWQRDPEHSLHQAVDLDRVALIGHSRGGEAVALAAAMNDLDYFPEDARERFDFGFGIRGVAAIAPVDGQFWPSGKPTELADIHYFTLHGGHDSDVSIFLGDRQARRVRSGSDFNQYQAALYIHHANHGQFNTNWGDRDFIGPASVLLNREPLLSGPDQRRAGKLYLTAFVEDALAASSDHWALFCNPDEAGALLPNSVYAGRCNNAHRQVLADFEEDINLRTGTLDGITIDSRGLALWAERDVGFRDSTSRYQTGAWLGWTENGPEGNGEPAWWTLDLDGQALEQLQPTEGSTIWIDLAQADRAPPSEDNETDNGESAKESPESSDSNDDQSPLRDPVIISVELEDDQGNIVTRPLSDFTRLYPPLPVRHTRLGLADRLFDSATEPVIQSAAIPLAAFAGENGFDPQGLRSIRLVFDRASEGVVIVERVAME